MNTEDYFKNNQMAIDIFNAKYAFDKENGEKENVLEVFTRVARNLAVYESEPEKWEKIWIDDMMEGWYRPGGSILSGVGSKSVISLANCTTIPLSEDSIQGINKCVSDMMLCAAKRQGLGVDVSVLRPKGAKVNNAANESTGAIPWMDYLQSMGNYVGQAGRRPAVLLSIKCNHPDVVEFIKSKTDLNLIQNANISVQITDAFMEAVIEDNEWELHFETKHEIISKIVKAKDIFELISESAHVSAEPGVQFIDLMRKGSMIHQIYLATGDERFCVVSTNACVAGNSFVHVRINGSPQVMLVKDVVSLFKNESKLIEIFSFDHETGMDCWSQITFAGLTRKNAELIEIEDDKTGFKITCTPDHKIFTLNRGYVRADQLNENDQIKTI